MEQLILFSWSGVLSALVAVAGFVAREKISKLNTLEQLLNNTKLEVTRDNVTKAEIEKLERYIDERFNKFEEKIDRLIEAPEGEKTEIFREKLFGKDPEKNLERAKNMAADTKNMKKGGKVSSASKRADGCAQRGKTKGRMV